VLRNFDIIKESGGAMRAVVKEFTHVAIAGELKLALTASKGETLLSGIELIRDDLPKETLIKLQNRQPRKQLFKAE